MLEPQAPCRFASAIAVRVVLEQRSASGRLVHLLLVRWDVVGVQSNTLIC
jgi:hypothetical protein